MLRMIPLALLAVAGAAGAQTQPSAVRANDQEAGRIAVRQDAQAMTNLSNEAQYAADLSAYDRALMRHDARADRQAARYRHQRRAYADAMHAWRAQVYACHHGSSRACNAPTPDPANYW